jgi:hypothetical protein
VPVTVSIASGQLALAPLVASANSFGTCCPPLTLIPPLQSYRQQPPRIGGPVRVWATSVHPVHDQVRLCVPFEWLTSANQLTCHNLTLLAARASTRRRP